MTSASPAKLPAALGWSPRPPEDAIVATVESLLRLGLLESEARATISTPAAGNRGLLTRR